ncbi:aldolase/citrate lyase family protein [Streptomyces sp. NPDC013157]|uniref:aldolase/citrate lyase family protein n=1 Tax=Streptomyces sp. NPDC013157 TaxID=3364861 RepID=UPI0036C5CC88
MNTARNRTTPLIGTWVKLPAVEVVELLATAGLDFVIIDLEHATLNIETVSQMVGSARASGLRPFVRVPEATAAHVQPVLDAGAAGVVVPRVEDVAGAQAAVQAVRFPPVGRRGASPSGRAGSWGTAGLADYLRGGDQITLIAQVESGAALAAIDSIAAVPGIDMIFIGEVDLAVSSGGGLDDPGLRRGIESAEAICRDKGIALGGAAYSGADAADRLTRGYSLITISTDLSFLRAGATAAAAAVRGTGHSTETPAAAQDKHETHVPYPAAGDARTSGAAAPAVSMRVVRDELMALVTAVWYEIDATDGSGVSRYFTGDATLTISRATVTGTTEIDNLYANRSARGPRVSRHCVTNLHLLDFDGNSARALSSLLLFAEDGRAPRRRTSPALVADVEDTFVRVDGRWLIQARHIQPQFMPEDAALAVPTE